MQQIANLRPSAMLQKLTTTAKLTNAVSQQALANAVEQWQDHIDTPNRHRDMTNVSAVADQLRLIITQIEKRRCRINPCAWGKLCKLEAGLRDAVYFRENLEPNSNIDADKEVA